MADSVKSEPQKSDIIATTENVSVRKTMPVLSDTSILSDRKAPRAESLSLQQNKPAGVTGRQDFSNHAFSESESESVSHESAKPALGRTRSSSLPPVENHRSSKNSVFKKQMSMPISGRSSPSSEQSRKHPRSFLNRIFSSKPGKNSKAGGHVTDSGQRKTLLAELASSGKNLQDPDTGESDGIQSEVPEKGSLKYFPKRFDLPDEIRIHSFKCALDVKSPRTGILYVSKNYLCFYSNIFSFKTQETIKISSITHIKPARLDGFVLTVKKPED
eukprot:1009986_1